MYAWGQMVSRHYVVLSYQAPYKISQLIVSYVPYMLQIVCTYIYKFANTDMISLHEPRG